MTEMLKEINLKDCQEAIADKPLSWQASAEIIDLSFVHYTPWHFKGQDIFLQQCQNMSK